MLQFYTMLATLLPLRKDTRGVTALEYGLIAALIAVVIIGALTTLGTSLSDKFSVVSSALGAAGGGASS